MADANPPHPQSRRGTLLVCDDEEGIRLSLKTIFGDHGNFEVLLAEDGRRAIEIAKQQHIDVAILDVRMPGMSGIEVLERLRYIDPSIEVIILTGFETRETLRQALRLRAADYVSKPFNVEAIRTVIEAAMSRRVGRVPNSASSMQEAGLDQEDLPAEVLKDTTSAFIHALNNILGNASGYGQLLGRALQTIEGEQGAKIRKFNDKLLDSFASVGYLLRRFQNAVGRHPGVLRPVNILKVLSDVQVYFSSRSSKPLVLDLPPDALEIMGDYELLWHLFENLIRNSIEAIEDRDTGMVTVSASGDRDVGEITIMVRDDGVGIAPDALSRIFDPSYTTKPGGMGIGLHLVRRAAHIHGGKVECESQLNIGTLFTVRLPSESESTGNAK